MRSNTPGTPTPNNQDPSGVLLPSASPDPHPGDAATELTAKMSLARHLEATTEDLICTVHAHPTMHESIHEAALAAEGRVIHA